MATRGKESGDGEGMDVDIAGQVQKLKETLGRY